MVGKGVLARAARILAQIVCAAIAVRAAIWLASPAEPLLTNDLRDWAHMWGPVIALGAAVLGFVLARFGLAPGRVLLRLPAPAFAAIAFAVALGTGIWAHFKLEMGVPDVPDEFSYLHQARGFADGQLAPPSPPMPEFHYV